MNSGSGLNSTCRIVHHLLTLGVFCFLFFLLFILLMATSVFVSEGTEIFTQVKGVILNKKRAGEFLLRNKHQHLFSVLFTWEL